MAPSCWLSFLISTKVVSDCKATFWKNRHDVKNYWNTKLKKKLVNMGIDPITHKPISRVVTDCHNIINFTTQKSSYSKLIRDQQQHTMPISCLLSHTGSSTYLMDFNYQTPTQQPFYVPQSPSGSSSSSCTVSQQPSFECFLTTNSSGAAKPPSSFSWIDHVLQDAAVCMDDDTYCTTDTITQGNFSNMPPVLAGHGRNSNLFEDCLSSSFSFVDSILDRDLEIMSDCPQLLDESCEYYLQHRTPSIPSALKIYE